MLDGDASYGILKISFLWMYIYWQQLQQYSFHQMASFISPGANEIKKIIQCQEGPSEGRIANSRGDGGNLFEYVSQFLNFHIKYSRTVSELFLKLKFSPFCFSNWYKTYNFSLSVQHKEKI